MKPTFVAHDLLFSEMIDQATIQQRIQDMGAELSIRYQYKNPLFIGVLNGAFIFLADLVRACGIPCEMDFVRISSYEGLQSSGKVHIQMDTKLDIKNRHLILVEDIVDTGRTLSAYIQELQKQEPASIAIVSLLIKPEALVYDLDVALAGFEIPPRFVIGYGLDYNEQGRHLPGIYQLLEK